MQIIDTLKRLMPRARDTELNGDGSNGRDLLSNGDSRALASFKADLAERAVKNTRHIPGEWQSRRT